MNEPRDPLEKVSNSIRRAVNVNRTRESDLKSKVNTLQRERRQSMNTWSLKQEKFLRAKMKMMPAIRFTNERIDKNYSSPSQRIQYRLTRGVRPVAMYHEDTVNISKEPQRISTKSSSLRSMSKYPNPLPPVPSGVSMETTSEPQNETSSPVKDLPITKIPSKRGITNYKSSVHEYLYGNKEENQRQAIRHKLSVHELENSKNLARKVSCYGTKHKKVEFKDDELKKNEGYSTVPSITSLLPINEEHGSTKARERWRKIRESLSIIVNKQKKKDITKMSLLELTSLFEGIRECRYLRVGNHTSYRGDSVDSAHCKCVACTVIDRNKLKNNLSAPQ